MNHDYYSDADLTRILRNTNAIALVGASAKPERPSFGVMRFLMRHGYTVIPVNPGFAGQRIQDQLVYENLASIPNPVDMIDVFRNNSVVPALVDEILALKWQPKFIWTQLGVYDLPSAARAERLGIEVVMNRCPAIEIPRLRLEKEIL